MFVSVLVINQIYLTSLLGDNNKLPAVNLLSIYTHRILNIYLSHFSEKLFGNIIQVNLGIMGK